MNVETFAEDESACVARDQVSYLPVAYWVGWVTNPTGEHENILPCPADSHADLGLITPQRNRGAEVLLGLVHPGEEVGLDVQLCPDRFLESK